MFTTAQQSFIEMGAAKQSEMLKHMHNAFGMGNLKVMDKRHTYIYSPPGIGKTFTANAVATKSKHAVVKIQGVASASDVTQLLAYHAYMNQGKQLTVWIDDCDNLFTDLTNLNIMKGALDNERNVWAYGKNLSMQINTLLKSSNPNDNLIGSALQHFQTEGSTGVKIPTDCMSFIITSNKSLAMPTSKKVVDGNAKAMAEAAIYDRCNYRDFTLKSQVQWGWLANITLEAKLHGVTKAQKIELLQWMWDSWAALPANSMRTVHELAAMIVNYPTNYRTHWAMFIL